jgi:hypothetical protein
MKKIILALFLSLCLISQGYCADQWTKAQLAGTTAAADIDTYNLANNEATDRLLYTYRQGCALVYASAATITVNSGALALPNSVGTVVRWRRNTSATTVAWANIDTGSEANATTYYVYGVADTDATTFTIMISTNSSAPTGATYYRRLGSFYNDASGNITQIVNDDNSGDIAFVKGQGNYYKIDSGSSTTGSTSFSFTYAAAPVVVACFREHGPGMSDPELWVYSVTTTGFSSLATESQTGHEIYWIAVGQVLAQ